VITGINPTRGFGASPFGSGNFPFGQNNTASRASATLGLGQNIGGVPPLSQKDMDQLQQVLMQFLMALIAQQGSQGNGFQRQLGTPGAYAGGMAPTAGWGQGGKGAANAAFAQPMATPMSAIPTANNFGESANGQAIANTARGIASARNTTGRCYAGVADALDRHGVHLSGMSAYMAADQLARQPKFKEVQVGAQQLAQLPAGAVVVWGKTGASPDGHISISDGRGNEMSDHIAPQRSQLRGHQNFRVFVPQESVNRNNGIMPVANRNSMPAVSNTQSHPAGQTRAVQDMGRIQGLAPMIERAARQHNMPPAVLAGIVSRESRGRNVIGDGGFGHGLAQIDSGSFGQWTRDWRAAGMPAEAGLHKGAEVFANKRRYLRNKFPNLTESQLLSATLSSYNAGEGAVARTIRQGRDPDSRTTGGDYARDVLNRASVFAQNVTHWMPTA